MHAHHRRFWHTAREYLTHWSVAGAILAVTGAAPEHWFSDLAHALPLPHATLSPWLEHVDYRLVAVIVGLSVIVGDNLWRHHGHPAPATTEAAVPVPPAGPAPAPEALPLPDKPSIAVLSFDNLSGDPAQEYFSDGIAEDIITQLSKSRALFVIARNSTFTYKGKATDIKQVGRELGVRYVLEGSVRKDHNRARITAQLIETATGGHLWAERYDRDLADIFQVQDEITENVSTAILPAVERTERERAARRPPSGLDAWECYHRGMWHFAKIEAAENARARDFFERAIALDPGFAVAHAALALTDSMDAVLFFPFPVTGRAAIVARAAEHACRAIACDPLETTGHSALALNLALMGRHNEAMAEADLAVSFDPNASWAHGFQGVARAFGGRPREAIEPLRTMMRLSPFDPLMPIWQHTLARAWYWAGEYQEALAAARQTCQSYPNFSPAYRTLIASLGQTGHVDEGRRVLAEALQRFGENFRLGFQGRQAENRPEDEAHMLDGYRKVGWDG